MPKQWDLVNRLTTTPETSWNATSTLEKLSRVCFSQILFVRHALLLHLSFHEEIIWLGQTRIRNFILLVDYIVDYMLTP